jgi:hypothetical protein
MVVVIVMRLRGWLLCSHTPHARFTPIRKQLFRLIRSKIEAEVRAARLLKEITYLSVDNVPYLCGKNSIGNACKGINLKFSSGNDVVMLPESSCFTRYTITLC